jgi:hypothetical protein
MSFRASNTTESTNEDLEGQHGEDRKGDDDSHEVARRLLESVWNEFREDHPDHGSRRETESEWQQWSERLDEDEGRNRH